jgi:hypothetical protein
MAVALTGFALAAMGASRLAEAAAPAALPVSCDPDGALRYVCGPVNAEDLIRLGDTGWIVTSGMDGPLNGGAPARGHLYLVDAQRKTWSDWFPGTTPAFRHDQSMFPDCPGPLDTSAFSAHGVALRGMGAGVHRLYVTGHGAREAIEIFEVQEAAVRGSRLPGFTPDPPTISWVGCVPLPAKVSANSVTVLDDGGFITTQFMDRSLPMGEAFGQVTRGEINGMLYEWHPRGKVEAIAGTELSGANGILASPDGRTIYVAAYGTHEVVRFERGAGPLRKQSVKLDITPDNLRWSPDGKILAAGGLHGGAPGATNWAVLELDPQTLAARRVAGGDKLTGMRGVTVGARIGNEIWVGTFSGNRIGYVPVQ